VPADTSSRCVSIGPLTPGSYTYVLRRMLGANEATCTHAVTVRAVGGSLQCAIDGPDVVVAGHAFELCGPSDAGTWGWSGPGVPPGSSSHCVTISGLGAGTYNYTLRCTRDADEGSCERSVVVTPDGGSVGPSCPTPLRFWLEQCRSDADGPVGIGARTLASVAACVEERIESWPWSGDRASFRELVESASLVPRDLLRQELAVLYANLCARDLGARLPDGSPIGLVGSTSFACSPLDKGHVDDLVARAENLLAHCSNARTSAATCPTELMALTMCLGRVTRGPATCAIALPPTPRVVTASSELARARFAPNPFSATTRMIYALPRASRVEAGVYDLNGRRVRALVSAALPAGVHELRWDGADDAGARVRPGMYFLRGTVGSEKLGVRVVYVK
jgi:hypothetical protein